MNVFVATPIDMNLLPVYKTLKCSECKQECCCSKASWEAIKNKKVRIVCLRCASGLMPKGSRLKVTDDQIKEIEQYVGRKLNKEEIRKIKEKMEDYCETPSYIG